MLYGVLHHKGSLEEQVRYLNYQLKTGLYTSVKELANAHYYEEDYLRSVLCREGAYYYSYELNQFVRSNHRD